MSEIDVKIKQDRYLYADCRKDRDFVLVAGVRNLHGEWRPHKITITRKGVEQLLEDIVNFLR